MVLLQLTVQAVVVVQHQAVHRLERVERVAAEMEHVTETASQEHPIRAVAVVVEVMHRLQLQVIQAALAVREL
jgi:hypothetical protein